MTIKELREKLDSCPEDAIVLLNFAEGMSETPFDISDKQIRFISPYVLVDIEKHR